MTDDPAAVGRRKRGRPPLLDHEARTTFLTAIRAGNRVPVAARFARINPKTVNEWIRRGLGLDVRPALPKYVRLVEDIEDAKAAAEVYFVSQAYRQAVRDPATVRWWLENQSPDWRQHELPVMPPPLALAAGPTVHANVIIVSPEDLERIGLDRLRAQQEMSGGGSDADNADARSRLVIEGSAKPVHTS